MILDVIFNHFIRYISRTTCKISSAPNTAFAGMQILFATYKMTFPLTFVSAYLLTLVAELIPKHVHDLSLQHLTVSQHSYLNISACIILGAVFQHLSPTLSFDILYTKPCGYGVEKPNDFLFYTLSYSKDTVLC